MKDDLKKYATKDDVVEFKDEILKGQDEIIGKLDKLLGEKTMGDAQDKRKTKISYNLMSLVMCHLFLLRKCLLSSI